MTEKRCIFIGLFIGILHLSVMGSEGDQAQERVHAFMMLAKEFDGYPTSDILGVTRMIQNAKSEAKAEAQLQALLRLYPPHERWKVEIIHRNNIYS